MIRYKYEFKLNDGVTKVFEVALHPETLALQKAQPLYPAWARLDQSPCEGCPLDRSKTDYCPIAVNIAGLVEVFKDTLSYEEADVVITTDDRTISKRTSVQMGLCSLMGIYMVTSGCPTLDRLRPMVRFHSPFAGVEETIYRSAGAYLLAQYFRKKNGRPADFDLEGFTQMYQEIKDVNTGLAQRLQAASKEDANVNAMANLDIFAITMQEPTSETVDTLRPFFNAYL